MWGSPYLLPFDFLVVVAACFLGTLTALKGDKPKACRERAGKEGEGRGEGKGQEKGGRGRGRGEKGRWEGGGERDRRGGKGGGGGRGERKEEVREAGQERTVDSTVLHN